MLGFLRKNKTSHIETIEDVKQLFAKHGSKATQLVLKYADEGNRACQKFLWLPNSDLMNRHESAELRNMARELFIRYATMAAESGDAEAQHGLAQYHLSQISDEDEGMSEASKNHLSRAIKWIRLSAASEFAPAMKVAKEYERILEERFGCYRKGK